jgi:hypothetical protein
MHLAHGDRSLKPGFWALLALASKWGEPRVGLEGDLRAARVVVSAISEI